MQTFRDRLIELMRLKGKTAYDIMRNTGMSQSTVGNYLKNEKLTPTLKILKKLSEYFAVDEHWLLTGEGSPFPTKSDSIVEELKQVAELIKEKDLEYYSARHSWATIARNKCQIDKHIVSEALNHTDQSMRVTDFYLEKDFTQINEANRRVLDYIKNTKAESIDPAF